MNAAHWFYGQSFHQHDTNAGPPRWEIKHWGAVLAKPHGDIVAQVHRYGTEATARIWPNRELGVFPSVADACAAVDAALAKETI
jgi:hypothetical protein